LSLRYNSQQPKEAVRNGQETTARQHGPVVFGRMIHVPLFQGLQSCRVPAYEVSIILTVSFTVGTSQIPFA
jgi:hypothetical protein